MKLEVYPSPMEIAWHWRLLDGDKIVARGPRNGLPSLNALLDDLDKIALVFPQGVELVKLEQSPRGFYG